MYFLFHFIPIDPLKCYTLGLLDIFSCLEEVRFCTQAKNQPRSPDPLKLRQAVQAFFSCLMAVSCDRRSLEAGFIAFGDKREKQEKK